MSKYSIAPDQKKARTWLKGLRSDEFKQGQSDLHNPKNNTYCCLGVKPRVCDSGFYTSEGRYPLDDEGEEFLSTEMAAEVGVSYEGQKELAHMNDSGDYTFSQIADFLEPKIIKMSPLDHIKYHARRVRKAFKRA